MRCWISRIQIDMSLLPSIAQYLSHMFKLILTVVEKSTNDQKAELFDSKSCKTSFNLSKHWLIVLLFDGRIVCVTWTSL